MIDPKLKEYLTTNLFKFSIEDSGLININDQLFYFHNVEKPVLEDNGELSLVFDNKLSDVVLKYLEVLSGVIYKLGPWYFYTKVDSLSHVDLEELKYLGTSSHKVYFDTYLGIHGRYERMCGVGEYSDWVEKAKFLGYKTLGICERGTLGGVLQFQKDCLKKQIKPILGYSLPVETGTGDRVDLKLYVKNQEGWSNLLLLNKLLHTSEYSYVEIESIKQDFKGLVCITEPGPSLNSKFINFILTHFENCFLQVSNKEYSSNLKDKEYLLSLQEYLDNQDWQKKLPPILIHDSYCLDSEHTHLRDILIKQGGVEFQNSTKGHYFHSSQELMTRFIGLFSTNRFQSILQTGIESLNHVSSICTYNIDDTKKFLPNYEMSETEKGLYATNNDLFIALLHESFMKKITTNKKEHWDRMIRELAIIKQGFVDYFLILWDICNWSRSVGIQVGPGRGSAAGSLISYLLGVTAINPLDFDLLFERFLNESRIKSEFPDIDIDFASDRRDEVIDYMKNKYGERYVCRVGTYNTLQLKGVVQELERYYGNKTEISADKITKSLEGSNSTWKTLIYDSISNKRLRTYVENNMEIVRDSKYVINSIKSMSIHACATIIVPKIKGESGEELDLFKQIPVRMDGDILVSEWEGDLLADIGYLKDDILSTKQMAKFGHIINLVEKNTGRKIDVDDIPLDDDNVFDLFRRGVNQDVFHFGTKGLTGYLKLVQPFHIEDLIATISLYRPGVMASGTHMKYVDLRRGIEEVVYDHPSLQELTANTYGLYIYQEQIMKIAQVLGNFTLVEADGVRKAMGKMIKSKMEEYRQIFLIGAEKNNCEESRAVEIWNKMEVFSSYGFNKCISGTEGIYRVGLNYSGSSTFNPTIAEMYKIKNDKKYAKLIGKLPLHESYNYRGYGTGFSLNKENVLIKNRIIDIRYEGTREVFKITLEDGKVTRTTDNHKYPTQRGEVILKDLTLDDCLFVNTGHRPEDTVFRFTDKDKSSNRYHDKSSQEAFSLNSQKGTEGFTTKEDTNYKKLQDYIDNYKKLVCETEDCIGNNLEVHHKDGDHGNNEHSNLETLCSSCHKKAHYRVGRVKMGEKGLGTRLVKIKSIESIGIEDVYDVEMDSPNHTFTTQEGIVTCNSHAAAYSIIGYQCNWLKFYYPLEFWTIALEFAESDKVSMMVSEINSSGKIEVKAPDINLSQREFFSSVDKQTIYWNLTQIAYMGPAAVEAVLSERERGGQFFSLEEFCDRVGSSVNKTSMINCIISGCFDEVEKIQKPSDRFKLIERYIFTLKGDFRLSKEDKILVQDLQERLHDDLHYLQHEVDKIQWKYLPEEYVNNRENNYYWVLKQSDISKISLLNYEKLVKDFKISGKILLEEDFSKEVTKRGDRYVLPGILSDVEVKTTKTSKSYCIGTLQQGASSLPFRMWSEAMGASNMEKFVNGGLVVLKGRLYLNDFFGVNEFLIEEFQEII